MFVNYMNDIKVSVIIVCLNAEKIINNSILSVLQQSYNSIELIIIDGLSSDNTINIVKEYIRRDNRIKFISQNDNGIYDAMNKGWKIASGEWILYLGADDELLPDGVKYLIEESNKDIDVVYGNVQLRFKNGYTKIQKSKPASILKRRNCCCHQSLIMRKSLFKNLNGFNEDFKILADYDLLLRAYLVGAIFKQINKTISIFSIGGASYSSKSSIDKLNILKANNLGYNSYVYEYFSRIKRVLVRFRDRIFYT